MEKLDTYHLISSSKVLIYPPSNLGISMSTYSIQNIYTIYSSILEHVLYNFQKLFIAAALIACPKIFLKFLSEFMQFLNRLRR